MGKTVCGVRRILILHEKEASAADPPPTTVGKNWHETQVTTLNEAVGFIGVTNGIEVA
jgi:hypothetical protein